MISRLVVAVAIVASAVVDARTTVSVVEVGVGGTVRRTTSSVSETTVVGVKSFWSALHGDEVSWPRKTARQVAGMTVVPDLFNRPDEGVVISVTGPAVADMEESMTVLSGLVRRAVGEMTIPGSESGELSSCPLETSTFHVAGSDDAAEADRTVAALLARLESKAQKMGTTIVIHVVVDDEEGVASQGRRLDQGDAQEEDEDNGNDGNNNDNNNNNNNDGGDDDKIHGYFNKYGEWVTNYRTMFQIQYFNLMLWTTVGLVVITIYSNWVTVTMPLMSDTLLFGESAKMMGE